MANRQIAGLTAENSLDTTFVIPVQIADGSQEAKKVDLEEVKSVFGIVEKFIKVSLTSADILSLFTTPKQLIPSTEGKLILPKIIFQKYTQNTSAYTYSGNVRIAYGTASNWLFQFTPHILSNGDGQALNYLSSASSGTGNNWVGLPLILTAVTSDPTSGDSTLDLHIIYDEITIS